MVPFSKIFKTYQWAILTGLLVGTTYIPFPPWALFFCYVPLWLWASDSKLTLKQIFWGGWLSQFVLTLIGFPWIAYVSKEFGFMPWPLAIGTLLLFAATVHLYIPLALVLASLVQRKRELSRFSFFALLSVLMALSEIYWPSLFPWNLGYPFLWIKSPVVQTTDIWGFQTLSLLVYLTNSTIAIGIQQRQMGRRRWIPAVSMILIWISLHIWGGYRKSNWSNLPESLTALVVQANIGNFEKFAAEKGIGFQQQIADQYFSQTRAGLKMHPYPDLVIWPESAFPDFLNDFTAFRPYTRQLISFVQEIKRPLMTGGYAAEPPSSGFRETYNGLFLYGPDGRVLVPPYHKTLLLAFGEYVPFGKLFPILKELNPGGPGFGKGKGPQVFTTDQWKIGVQVCYESLDPQFTSDLAKLGAEVLVNVTNDSWFGNSFEPHQHLFMTLARAIESRRPMIRSTNTGISAAIQADGEISELSPLFQSWTGELKVKYLKSPPLTIHSRFGHLIPYFLILLSLFLIWNPSWLKSTFNPPRNK